MTEYKVLRYRPSEIVKQTYKDGGVAIIDQIICSHARSVCFAHIIVVSHNVSILEMRRNCIIYVAVVLVNIIFCCTLTREISLWTFPK